MITLTHIALGLTQSLSDRLLWTDEFGYSPVLQEQRFGTDGGMHVHVGLRAAGRPITLGGVESQAWINRVDVTRLQAWASLPGVRFSLFLRGEQRTVLFDHSRAPAFSADPVWQLADGEQSSEEMFRPTFNFLEI